jgi:uncharacterized membrane protein
MGKVFWLITLGLAAVISHISYLLFAPGYMFDRSMSRLTTAETANSFFVVGPEAQAQLFPTYPADSVFGMCKFDLASGSVLLNATMPVGYWTLTVYTQSGKEFYALNDQQSGTQQFSVQLNLAKSAVEILTSTGGDGENPVSNLGWTVESHEPKGVAVFWVPVADPLLRKAAIETITTTKCTVKPKA